MERSFCWQKQYPQNSHSQNQYSNQSSPRLLRWNSPNRRDYLALDSTQTGNSSKVDFSSCAAGEAGATGLSDPRALVVGPQNRRGDAAVSVTLARRFAVLQNPRRLAQAHPGSHIPDPDNQYSINKHPEMRPDSLFDPEVTVLFHQSYA